MTPQQRAVIQHMIEVLEQATPHMPVHTDWHFEAIEWGKKLLEQPEQADEPAAWMYDQAKYGPTDLRGQQWWPALSRSKPYTENGMVRELKPLYTRPRPAAWVELLDDDFRQMGFSSRPRSYAAISAKLREKNGGA